MTYRTTLARPTIRMTFSRRLRMPMMGNHPCLTILGGGQDGDLIIAFFPCIYFCQASQSAFTYTYNNYVKMDIRRKTQAILDRSVNRQYFYTLLIKLFCVVQERDIRMIVENPYSGQHYLILSQNFVMPPTIIDHNRMLRGDYFEKPTAYWFIKCKPTEGFTMQMDKKKKTIMGSKQASKAGLCSEERSMISPDYARNFICDFILGRPQPEICPTLFDEM